MKIFLFHFCLIYAQCLTERRYLPGAEVTKEKENGLKKRNTNRWNLIACRIRPTDLYRSLRYCIGSHPANASTDKLVARWRGPCRCTTSLDTPDEIICRSSGWNHLAD